MKKKTSLPVEMEITCCSACFLSERMKKCKTCSFRIGLGFKAIKRLESTILYTPSVTTKTIVTGKQA